MLQSLNGLPWLLSTYALTYVHKHSKKNYLKRNICSVSECKIYTLVCTHTHTRTASHLHKIMHISLQRVHSASLSDIEITFCTKTHINTHTHTHTQCFDPREQASCVCAGAVTSALIINQWANCKRTQSASLAHMTSPMHVSIHRVYKPFKVSGPLQYSWLIITDGRHTLCNTLH